MYLGLPYGVVVCTYVCQHSYFNCGCVVNSCQSTIISQKCGGLMSLLDKLDIYWYVLVLGNCGRFGG